MNIPPGWKMHAVSVNGRTRFLLFPATTSLCVDVDGNRTIPRDKHGAPVYERPRVNHSTLNELFDLPPRACIGVW
jgi:hypothetical protein